MKDDSSSPIEPTLEQAIAYHRDGELTKAELAYTKLLEAQPDHADAIHLLGVIAHQMGDGQVALERIRKSLTLAPAQPIAWNNLGNVHAAGGRLEEAADSYRRAIELRPAYVEPHHNLANVLSDIGQSEAAIESYRRAIDLRPNDATSHVSLGTILEKTGQLEQAMTSYRQAIEYQPDSPAAHGRLGAVLRKAGRLDEARAVYDLWLQVEPDSPVALHLRSACVAEDDKPRATNEYVTAFFDGIAEEFDECLADLEYRVPDLIAAALSSHITQPPPGNLDVLDLGCGTGLCAGHLQAYARQLTGVDLSAGMLDQARQRGMYDQLVEAELTEFLSGCAANYDLIISADTLEYIGQLQPVFTAAAGALRSHGLFIFTVEKMVAEPATTGYRLNRFGRYVHAPDHVREWLASAGFEILEWTEEVLRNEGNDPVAGLVITART